MSWERDNSQKSNWNCKIHQKKTIFRISFSPSLITFFKKIQINNCFHTVPEQSIWESSFFPCKWYNSFSPFKKKPLCSYFEVLVFEQSFPSDAFDGTIINFNFYIAVLLKLKDSQWSFFILLFLSNSKIIIIMTFEKKTFIEGIIIWLTPFSSN